MTDTQPLNYEEMLESLTGFDEIAIENAFGFDAFTIGQKSPMKSMRSMAFIHYRREGAKDAAAHEQSMGLTVKELYALFDDDEEPMPDDPTTESGKGDTPLEPEPEPWRHSASEPG